MYKMVKMTTFAMLNVTKLYCAIWFKLRCRLFRRIQDLSYHVFDLRDNYANEPSYRKAMVNIPFISKIVEVNDDTEKTSVVKIGSVCVRYSIKKTVPAGDLRILSFDAPEAIIAKAIEDEPQFPLHHKAKVVQLRTNRKESDVTDRKRSC